LIIQTVGIMVIDIIITSTTVRMVNG